MDFEPNELQRAVEETARRFARERVAPVAAENDRLRRFPADLVRGLGEPANVADVEAGVGRRLHPHQPHALVDDGELRVRAGRRGPHDDAEPREPLRDRMERRCKGKTSSMGDESDPVGKTLSSGLVPAHQDALHGARRGMHRETM